jgi:homogentisate phytyltransferase / homogentisate geranylgeranyltransferase
MAVACNVSPSKGSSAVIQHLLLCSLIGAAALAIGAAVGSAPLLLTLVGSLVLGILYSTELPFMRWKRSPMLAAACILAVR